MTLTMNTVSADSLVITLKELNGIVDNLLLLLSDKEKEVIVKRFNLNGEKKYTLEEIGQDFSVTRERIRQIEKTALSKMKRNVFNTSLNSIHDFTYQLIMNTGGICTEDKLMSFFRREEFKQLGFKEDHLHLVFVLDERTTCIGNTILFNPYIRLNNLSDFVLKQTASMIVNELRKTSKIIDIESLLPVISKKLTDNEITTNFLKSLVSLDKRLILIDDNSVALKEWRHIHPRTLRDKILFVLRKENNPLHFSEISTKIDELSFDRKEVNIQAVHNELIRHDMFVLIGRGIYALTEWGYEPGTVTDVIKEFLLENGDSHQDDIVSHVLSKRQVKRITVLLALKNSSIFHRSGRKHYSLKN